MRIFITTIIIALILSCSKGKKNESKSNPEFNQKIEQKPLNEIKESKDEFTITNSPNITKLNYPKYPIIGKAYKFLALRDSIHYAIGIKRLDSLRIEYIIADERNGDKMEEGIASISKKKGYKLTEKSIVTNNSYKATEFIEQKENCSFSIRIGTDSVGSGNRLLLRFLKKCNNKIITDISLAN
jgi:hypothetical protein